MTNHQNMSKRSIINDMNQKQKKFFIVLGGSLIAIIVLLMILWNPLMKPWTQERLGLANLLKAEFENQMQAETSAAEREAAVLRAEAITIVGAVAQKYPEYRSQEFIGGFADALKAGTTKQTFYIPTRNSIPVLPAMSAPPQE